MHLASVHKMVKDFQPHVVIVDPITTFVGAGTAAEAESLLVRLIDFFKAQQITTLFTSLTHGDAAREQSHAGISSLIDTWLLLRDIELGGERNRGIYVLKSRGMAHSNQIREFLLTDHGVELRDVYVGPEGVLTGSMRLAQEAREQASTASRQLEIDRRRRELERKRQALDAQIAAQRAEFEAEQEELQAILDQEQTESDRLRRDRDEMAQSRKSDEQGPAGNSRARKIANQGGRK
jgi:circadian clock protein KaiC